MKRKFAELNSVEKLFGLSFVRFSQGGIVLEQDFKRQFFCLGYLGGILTAVPYLIVFAVLGFWLLFKIRDRNKFCWENLLLFMSYSLGMIIAYSAGMFWMNRRFL